MGHDFSKWPKSCQRQADGKEKWLGLLLDLFASYDDKADYMFRRGEDGLIISRNIIVVKGAEKSGKSALCTAFVAAALGGEALGIKCGLDKPRVLWIDTEQPKPTFRQRIGAAVKLSGAELAQVADRLDCAALNGLRPKECAEAVPWLVRRLNPDLVVLDGYAQLSEDFNNNMESQAVTTTLKAVAEECGCAIIGVIHTNKRDDSAKGHLGGELQHAASEVFEVRKSALDDGTALAEVLNPINRFAPVQPMTLHLMDGFAIEDGGQVMGRIREDKRADEAAELREMFRQVFVGRDSMTYKELRGRFSELYGVSERTAARRAKEAEKDGTLVKDGKTYSYMFPPESDEELSDL